MDLRLVVSQANLLIVATIAFLLVSSTLASRVTGPATNNPTSGNCSTGFPGN